MARIAVSTAFYSEICLSLALVLSFSCCTLEVSQRKSLLEADSSFVQFDQLQELYQRRTVRSTRSSHYDFGTDFIANTFGGNGYLNLSGVNSIMSRLRLGRYSVFNTRYQRRNECLTAEQVLQKGGFNNTVELKGQQIDSISSILIQQLVEQSCLIDSMSHGEANPKEDPGKAWGFSILCVTIISLASMVGAFVVPFMNREFYQTLLLFMVSLAVGVLCGSGVFHLLPSTFGLGYDGNTLYLWKASVIVGGIYFFFITENLMKIYIRFIDFKKEDLRRRRRRETGNTNALDSICSTPPPLVSDNMHDVHALDSVHVSDKNCFHEHGLDSLHMAGDHQINKEDTMEYFVKPDGDSNNKKTQRIAPVAWMIIIGDGLHNFIDGLAIGAAFTSSVLEGVSTSLAIFCEEMPHELGDFAILLNSGMSYRQAILCNFLSACTCYLGMVIGVMLGRTTSAVKWIYALAAGMFLYISLVDMLPEATGMQVSVSGRSKKETFKNFALVNFAMILGFVIMFLLALYGGEIQV